MPPNTIPPPAFAVAPDVDPALLKRWKPDTHVEREIDKPRPSAFPAERRFTTIYPGSRASDEATAAAFQAARDHDRSSSSQLLDVLYGRPDDDG